MTMKKVLKAAFLYGIYHFEHKILITRDCQQAIGQDSHLYFCELLVCQQITVQNYCITKNKKTRLSHSIKGKKKTKMHRQNCTCILCMNCMGNYSAVFLHLLKFCLSGNKLSPTSQWMVQVKIHWRAIYQFNRHLHKNNKYIENPANRL